MKISIHNFIIMERLDYYEVARVTWLHGPRMYSGINRIEYTQVYYDQIVWC